MDKEETLKSEGLENTNAQDTWLRLYNKKLDCKKNILEYIEIAKILKKDNSTDQLIIETYNFIYQHIEQLKDSIKPNTMLYLKNTLNAQFGKYIKEKNPTPHNSFLEFFKEAYPKDTRRKDFTWVIMDVNNISYEQIWTTLTYINRQCLNNNLSLSNVQKKDIIEMIRKTVAKNNIKYINDIRALKPLTDLLEISILSKNGIYKVIKK